MIDDLRFTIDDLRMKARRFVNRQWSIRFVNRQWSIRFVNRQSSIVNRKWLSVSLLLIAVAVVCFGAQPFVDEAPRDESKFTFARIFFNFPMRGPFWGAVGDSNGPPWSHDYPRSEEHLMKIMAELTRLDVNPSGHIISFQSDECFKYPIAYLCEVGYINLSEEEARRMAEYLLRGGFLIVDDFRGPRELYNFRNEMKKVFPDRRLEPLPRTHDIWKSFYDISDLKIEPPPIYSRSFIPEYYGMSDDTGRLMMVVDYNNDISEYWEWSGDMRMPIDETNEAYKYGVNYIMYALMH